ncbi:hypothetical protein PA25_01160 [Pseudoalteromonas sp. A25]|uniref:hypothetical protein n=1 Tax=Pseudoalteromonas sp. A25 TaxID=116092 RepID=UPI00126071D3|nr:hypothetical protein [Pseudoalteromonas sp. A25]BBN80131.1 hypothetical protein PA25_01160 [Pseudoalteromonas sp. A25]
MSKYITLLISLFVYSHVYARPYTINASEGLAYELGQEKVIDAMNAIYAPLSITPEVIFLPSRRGLQLVDNGQLDAEAGRIEGAVHNYQNLIKISYPLSQTRLSIYCIQAQNCSATANSSAVTIQGGLIAQQFCKKQHLNCTQVMNDISAFKALEKHHAPAIIANDRFALATICESGLRKLYTRPLTKELPIHHYVHNKHAALVPKITKSIEQLVQSSALPNTFQSLSDAANECGVILTEIENNNIE